jgi:hypothetical protein
MAVQSTLLQTSDDIESVFETMYNKGWTDGLPVIPPTPERVARMLATTTRRPDEVIAQLPPLRADATIEKIAINAVMAGCRPEYFPTVLASVEAVADPHYELYGINTTTNPTVPFIIVNGPIRNELDVNCSWSVLGPSKRANATIGRALSLVMINLAGRIPELACKATWKMPGAYTMCAGEYEEESPWEPLHVERGFAAGESTVTLMSPNAAMNIVDTESQNADELLLNIGAGMLNAGGNGVFPFYGLGEVCLMICPGHARVIAEQYSKRQVQEFLLDYLKLPVDKISPRRVKMMEAAGHGQIENGYVRYAQHAWQFLIFVAGGLGGYHTAAFTTFGDSRAVTRAIAPIAIQGEQ